MTSAERHIVEGPAGRIELLVETPPAVSGGIALIGHPHPLFGGTLDNKVAATLARAFLSLGWVAVRPNFRGVGRSDGVHDDGVGETQDFLHLADLLPRWPQWERWPALRAAGVPLALAGFSFGSFVAARAAQALTGQGRPPRHLVLVGAAAGKWPMPPVDPGTLVIHGEVDDTIALADVFAWARGSEVPVVVMPGTDHFFHRRLTTLKRLLIQNLAGAALAAPAGPQPASGEQSGDH